MMNLTERGERKDSLLVHFPRVKETGFYEMKLPEFEDLQNLDKRKARQRHGWFRQLIRIVK